MQREKLFLRKIFYDHYFFFFLDRYIFLEYNNHLNALSAVKSTNNYKIDKSHTFKVNLFTDFKKYEDIPENWEPPIAQPFKSASDLHYHLLEPDAYDQFCVLCGNGAGVSVQIWQNSAPEPTLLEERNVSSFTFKRKKKYKVISKYSDVNSLFSVLLNIYHNFHLLFI